MALFQKLRKGNTFFVAQSEFYLNILIQYLLFGFRYLRPILYFCAKFIYE